ncbi:MAG TPA: ABC transporter ATP-binding protein [Candidatus Limnocylindrales bacterium]
MTVLSVEHLSVFYGPVRGVEDVGLTVEEGEIVALLGANGAGKSTVLQAISGLVKPRTGRISFRGQSILGASAARRVKLGVVQVPEGRRIFASLSVRENLELGAYAFGLSATARRARVGEILELFPLLLPHVEKLAGMLSGGEQQLLAIARAMMARPTLLMVDEPSLGLAPQMIDSVYELLVDIAKGGTAVLLVEQNVTLALEITQRAFILQQGSLALSGTSADLVDDPRVIAAYLGGGAERRP